MAQHQKLVDWKCVGRRVKTSNTMFDWKITAVQSAATSTSRAAEPTVDISMRVLAVGSAGIRALQYMMDKGLAGASFIALDTTSGTSPASCKTADLCTEGITALPASNECIRAELAGASLLFLVADMGSRTGTSAASRVACVAQELGILTVSAVLMPSRSDGTQRSQIAEEGLQQFQTVCNPLLIAADLSAQKFGSNCSLVDIERESHRVLYGAVRGFADIASASGINDREVDQAELRAVMEMPGRVMASSGSARGEARAQKAVEEALGCAVLQDADMGSASGVLVHISARQLHLSEQDEIVRRVRQCVRADAQVVFGLKALDGSDDLLRVMVAMTGMQLQPLAPVPRNSEQDWEELDIPSLLRDATGELSGE